MNKTAKRSIIVSAVLAIIMCVSLAAGATFALFTSESKVNITVSSGKVNVVATIEDLQTYSGKDLTGNAEDDAKNRIFATDNQDAFPGGENLKFTNGGTATLDPAKQTLTLDKMTPGDKVTFNIKVQNDSNVAIKYRTKITATDKGLYDALTITIGDVTFDRKVITAYKTLEAKAQPDNVEVTVDMPSSIGNEYQDLSCTLHYVVEAIQGNAVGEADTYPVYPTNVTKDSFTEGNNVAYVDNDNVVKYVADINEAINAGASVIYVKEGATLANYGTPDLTSDLTIYGNGANFSYRVIGLNGTNNGKDHTSDGVSLTIYDANNLKIWGYAPKSNSVNNVTLENCTYEGNGVGQGSSTKKSDGIFYISKNDYDATGQVNLTMNNCKVSGCNQGVYTNLGGTINITNSVFVNCATAIKASHKNTTGTLTLNVSDTTFISCGWTEYIKDMEWLADDSAAIKCKTKSSDGIKLNLTDVSVIKTIGDYSFHIDDDEHDKKYTGSTTVTATNVTVDGVTWTYNGQ